MFRYATTIAACLILAATPAAAQTAAPAFAKMFSDHAVVQRDEPVRLWGTAAAGSTVSVTLGDNSGSAVVDADGKWRIELPALPAGGPYSLSVSDGAQTTTLNDILVGDVFLCSGQSNMEFPVKFATNAWNEIHSAPPPNLRFLNIARDGEGAPLGEIGHPAAWQVAGPETTGDASAVCYYMTKSLQTSQNVPIGFIDSYWGGTLIQSWMSDAALRKFNIYSATLDGMALYARDPKAAEAQWGPAFDAAWTKPAADDKKWAVITPSGPWEDSGIAELAAYDGIIWYRNTVTLTAAQAQNAVRIELGAVDDADTTWINGVEIGSTNSYNAPRNYAIPAGTLKAGRNVIAVRAVDNGGGGGLTARPEDRRIVLADGSAVPLPAQWKYKTAGAPPPWTLEVGPGMLYNGMIAPLTQYNIKAVAWYQGEANAGRAEEYAQLLPAWMADWRRAFNKPDLPFLIVQLTAFGPVATQPGTSTWAELREAQRNVVNADPHAALAVIIDFGDRSDIHPTQKTIVGERLARAARALVYGEDVTRGGPEPVSVTRTPTGLAIRFKNVNGGLRAYSSNEATGFEICDAAKVCKYATAFVFGDTVTLEGEHLETITHIRYAWADSPYTNLYSGDDLPAVPFEMDVSQ